MSDSEQVTAGKLVKQKIDAIMVMIKGYASNENGTPGWHDVRGAITKAVTESYSLGLKDAIEDLGQTGGPIVRQSMEVAQASVRAVERIADALERAHPPMYEWMATDEELNGQPSQAGNMLGWSGHAWDDDDPEGAYDHTMRFRRPLGSTGPWERVR